MIPNVWRSGPTAARPFTATTAAVAAELTPRVVLEKFYAVQMVDMHLPTTDNRTVILSRHPKPERELQVLLEQLKLTLPTQPRRKPLWPV